MYTSIVWVLADPDNECIHVHTCMYTCTYTFSDSLCILCTCVHVYTCSVPEMWGRWEGTPSTGLWGRWRRRRHTAVGSHWWTPTLKKEVEEVREVHVHVHVHVHLMKVDTKNRRRDVCKGGRTGGKDRGEEGGREGGRGGILRGV